MQSIDITQLADWLADTDIDLLTLDAPMGHLRLKRGGAVAETPVEAGPRVAAGARAAPSEAAEPTEAAEAAGGIVVRASSVGVFLDAHPLRAAPFVRPGGPVVQDQLVGLMKIGALLLPVRAPCAGTADAPAVATGATVGYGTPLLVIRPHAAP